MQALVERSSRLVLMIGPALGNSSGPLIELATVRADQLAELLSPGQKAIDVDGVVTTVPRNPPDLPPDPPDFGADVPGDFAFQLAGQVSQVRAYLGNPNPTAAVREAAIRAGLRLVLYLVKRQLG